MEKRFHEGVEEVRTFAVPFEIKSASEGVIEGYASTFGNVDSYGDIIEPGAFRDSISVREPVMLWQHNMDDPIGIWPEYREDDTGLYVRGKIITDATRGRDAFALIKGGAVRGLSIGFRAEDWEMRGNNRVLKRIGLFEISAVTIGANDKALIREIRMQKLALGQIDWRNAEKSTLERVLRDAWNLSQSEAKSAFASAYRALLDRRDAGEDVPDDNQRDVEAVKAQLETLLRSISQ